MEADDQKRELDTIRLRKDGRLDEKTMERILNAPMNYRRAKSVPSLCAQTTKQCGEGDSYLALVRSLEQKKERILKENCHLWYIIEGLMYNGCRISEILSIRASDITVIGTVNIRAKKGSENRIIHFASATEFLKSCRLNNIKPFELYDRFYVYRQFKKYGISIHTGNSSKNSVTHSFRHLYINSARKENIQAETIQKSVGHKNKANTEKYGKLKNKTILKRGILGKGSGTTGNINYSKNGVIRIAKEPKDKYNKK